MAPCDQQADGGTPPPPPDSLDLRIVNRLPEIRRVADLVSGFCTAHRLPARIVFCMNLALDEILTNVISHALDGRDHEIAVRVRFYGYAIAAEVIDDGPAFDPLQLDDSRLDAPLEERPVGGLGVFLVKTLMDSVSYRRSESRNHLLMTKHVGAAEDPRSARP